MPRTKKGDIKMDLTFEYHAVNKKAINSFDKKILIYMKPRRNQRQRVLWSVESY